MEMGGKKRRRNNDRRPKENDKKAKQESDFVATQSTIYENKKDATTQNNTELGAQSKDEIDQMMLDTCNLTAVYNFVKAVSKDLLGWSENVLTRGLNERKVIAVIDPNRKLEDNLYQQITFHLKDNWVSGPLMEQRASKDSPIRFLVDWMSNNLSKYPQNRISEQLEEIFHTFEIEKFPTIAHKGQRLLSLVGKLVETLKAIYQIPTKRTEGRTELSGTPIKSLRENWEKMGPTIEAEFRENLRAIGMSTSRKVAELDTRPSRVLIDQANHEIIVPVEETNDFGHPKKRNLGKKINQLKLQLEAMQGEHHGEDERLQIETIIEMLKSIQNMENGPNKDLVIRDYIGVIYELISEAVLPEGENQLFLSMDLGQLREAYTSSLLNAYDRLGAEEYKEMLSQVEELAKLVDAAMEKNTMKEATILAVERNMASSRNTRSNTGGETAGQEEDGWAVRQEKEGWTACGAYETMLVKIDLVDVGPGNHGEKPWEECVFRRVKFLKLNVHRIDIIIRGLVITLKDLIHKIEEQNIRIETESGVPYSSEHVESLSKEKSRLEGLVSKGVEEIMAVLREVALGCQLQLKFSQTALSLLDKTTDQTDCWVILVETTQKSCDEYAGLIGRCLPKVLKSSTFNALQKAAKALVSIKKFRLSYRICQEVATIRFIWKANLIMKMSVVRHSEAKSAELKESNELKGAKESSESLSKSDLEKLIQCKPMIDELLKAQPKEPKRFSPCPELMDDEELAELDEEDRANLRKFLNQYNPESYEVFMNERNRPAKKIGNLLKRHLNDSYVAMADDVYHDIPVEFMELCPSTGKERINFLEAQESVSWLRDLENRVVANQLRGTKTVVIPEEAEGMTKARAKLQKMGISVVPCNETEITVTVNEEITEEDIVFVPEGVKGDLTDYPGLEIDEEPTTILVVTQVKVKPCGGSYEERSANLKQWSTKLPIGSYGEAIADHNKVLSEDRKLSKERSYHAAQGVCQNSDFSSLAAAGSQFIETENSCGKGCPPKSRECFSQKPGVPAHLRKEHPQCIGRCALEWYRKMKDNVTLSLIQTMMRGMINFNGDQPSVRKIEVENQEKHITHNVIKITVPCVVLTGELVPSVNSDLEFMATEPGLLTVHYPERYGEADLEPTLRPVRLIQNGLIFIPRFLLPMVWVVSNCLIGVNLADERTAVPRYQVLNMCKICAKTYLSPLSLLLHLLYEEMVLGDVNEIDTDHENCGQYALCTCRLKKTAKVSKDEATRADVDKKNNTKKEKSFDSNSYVQLKILESVDVSLMEIGEILNVMILCNQIGMMCFIPGGSFGKRWSLTVQEKWQQIPIWGNLYIPIIRCGSSENQSFLSENWKMEKYSNIRLCPSGRPMEVGVKEMADQLVERSQNIKSSAGRFASIGNQGMTRDINPSDPKFVKINMLKDRIKNIDFLEHFIPIHEEILSQNVVKFCLLKAPIREKPEDYQRRVRLYRLVYHLYQDRSEVHKTRLQSLAKIPIDEGKFSDKNLFDTVVGPMIGAFPEELAKEEFEIDLNRIGNEQIVPGKELTYRVPETKLEPKMEEAVTKISKKEAKIYTKGWESDGRPKKYHSIESTIKREFVPTPTVEELEAAREEELKQKRRETDISNNEGKAFQRSKWKCGVCANALSTLPGHKGGCYYKVCPKEQKKADNEIEKICEENKKRRLAKEAKAKEVIEKVEDEKPIVEEKSAKSVVSSEIQRSSPRESIISNETIEKLDHEVDVSRPKPKLSNEDEHGTREEIQDCKMPSENPAKAMLNTRKRIDRIDRVLEALAKIEEELSDDTEQEKKPDEMEENDNAIKVEDMFVYEKTAEQLESDDVVRALILQLEETNDPMEQIQLANLIQQEARTVATAVSQMEDGDIYDDDMDTVAELLGDEEDDEEGNEENNADHDDINAIEEPSESDGEESVKIDDVNDDGMKAVEFVHNETNNNWCYGGYDEKTKDFTQCGKPDCRNCY